MRTRQTIVNLIPDIEEQELDFIHHLTGKLDDNLAQGFFIRYAARRRKSDTVLLLTLLGFIVIAGVHRFYLNQNLMGFLYLFTGGFCLIGTIIDVVNHKQLTFEHNEELALDIMDDLRYGS